MDILFTFILQAIPYIYTHIHTYIHILNDNIYLSRRHTRVQMAQKHYHFICDTYWILNKQWISDKECQSFKQVNIDGFERDYRKTKYHMTWNFFGF